MTNLPQIKNQHKKITCQVSMFLLIFNSELTNYDDDNCNIVIHVLI